MKRSKGICEDSNTGISLSSERTPTLALCLPSTSGVMSVPCEDPYVPYTGVM